MRLAQLGLHAFVKRVIIGNTLQRNSFNNKTKAGPMPCHEIHTPENEYSVMRNIKIKVFSNT